MTQLKNNKNQVIKALATAWNLYLEQYSYQANPDETDDLNDFRKAIHDAQRIVMTKEYIAYMNKPTTTSNELSN